MKPTCSAELVSSYICQAMATVVNCVPMAEDTAPM